MLASVTTPSGIAPSAPSSEGEPAARPLAAADPVASTEENFVDVLSGLISPKNPANIHARLPEATSPNITVQGDGLLLKLGCGSSGLVHVELESPKIDAEFWNRKIFVRHSESSGWAIGGRELVEEIVSVLLELGFGSKEARLVVSHGDRGPSVETRATIKPLPSSWYHDRISIGLGSASELLSSGAADKLLDQFAARFYPLYVESRRRYIDEDPKAIDTRSYLSDQAPGLLLPTLHWAEKFRTVGGDLFALRDLLKLRGISVELGHLAYVVKDRFETEHLAHIGAAIKDRVTQIDAPSIAREFVAVQPTATLRTQEAKNRPSNDRPEEDQWRVIAERTELIGELQILLLLVYRIRVSRQEAEQLFDTARTEFRAQLLAESLDRHVVVPSRSEVDQMSGPTFEELLARLFRSLGWEVRRTGRAGDQGADLILFGPEETVVVQAKRHGSPVGNFAVQEIVAAVPFYHANRAICVTNATFTAAAIELARANSVELIDGADLHSLLQAHL